MIFSICFCLFFACAFLHFCNVCFFLLRFFLLPFHFILKFVIWRLFIYLWVWQYNSLYDYVSPVRLPKCLFFILQGHFAVPRGEKGLEIQEKTATGWQWRRGQAKHIPRELGNFRAGIQKQMWERLSILPPWPETEEADSGQWTHFFPLASPQIPLLLLTVSPGLQKEKQSDFFSSIPVQQTIEWGFKSYFSSLQKCALHVAFHQLNLIPPKYFDPAIYQFLGLCSPWISGDYVPEFAYPVGRQLHFRGRLVLWLQPSFYMPATTIYPDQRL